MVGVPLSTPLLARFRPGGNEPAVTSAKVGVGFPDAVNVKLLYAAPTLPVPAGVPLVKLGAVRVVVVPPPGAFLQATREGERALLGAVIAAVGGGARIADLFAGVGTFALPLTERADVLAVEGDAAMTAAMEKGWRAADGLKRLVVQARDAMAHLETLLRKIKNDCE